MNKPRPIQELLKKLDIETKNPKIYIEALTHNSYNNENKVGYTYQKLEFLGDVVISKLVSVFLYYQDKNESEMTELRKKLVNTDIFRNESEKLGLLNYAYIGNGVDLEKDTRKIKTDLFESIAGAIYIDKGEKFVWEYLKKSIMQHFYDGSIDSITDYKTRVQELLHQKVLNNKKNSKGNIFYNTIELEDKTFKATLTYNEITYGEGFGTTKKEAQTNAAKDAYLKFVVPNKK